MNNLKEKDLEKFNVNCPQCGRREYIGFLGGSSCRRYFCRDCCTEFTIKNGIIKVYPFNSNGLIEEEKEP